MKLVWLTAAVLALVCTIARAASLADGVEAYGTGDDPKAFAIFSELATAGDPAAQHFLGKMYLEGRGTNPDVAQASKWLTEAANKGDPKSAYLLGSIAEEQQDRKVAVDWYKRAADAGDDRAMTSLGAIFIAENNPERNTQQAIEWFTKAAGFGNATAAFNLGVLYTNGPGKADKGFKKDAAAGERWFKQAAEGGHVDAQYNLGVIYLDRNEPAEAAKWFQHAAGQGEPQSQFILATMYAEGAGVEKNLVEAMAWHDLAAQKGAGNLELRRYLAKSMSKQQVDQAQRLVAERARSEAETLTQ